MKKYYFLACSLPTLKIGLKPEISFEELKDMMAVNLNAQDKKRVERFMLFTDLCNLRLFWLNKQIDPRGNLNQRQLEEALEIRDNLPEYVFDFLDRYESAEDRLKNYSSLWVSFFEERESEKGFLREYFQFEHEYRLILSALRAKQRQKDIAAELQFEDPADLFIAYILAQKDMENFEPPSEYEDLKGLFLENMADPMKLYRALLDYRFGKIEDLIVPYPFSVDYIMGYLAELIIAEDWAELDKAQGREIVDSLM